MSQDRWARWVLRLRDSGDVEVRTRGASLLAAYRDGVLDRAAVREGDVLLDVGTGDGLVGFGALDRVGPDGRVIFSDVSADLLAVADRSVYIVTTRSVLIYVARKQAAFAELFRVLRPGGRLSIFEPINSFMLEEACYGLFGLDLTPVADLVPKVRGAFRAVPPEQDPMLNFDERDLLRWVRDAGFTAVELDYRAEVDVPEAMPTTDWEALKKMAPNPLAPTYEEALAQALTDQERERFEAHVRAVLAAGAPARKTIATVFLRAVRP